MWNKKDTKGLQRKKRPNTHRTYNYAKRKNGLAGTYKREGDPGVNTQTALNLKDGTPQGSDKKRKLFARARNWWGNEKTGQRETKILGKTKKQTTSSAFEERSRLRAVRGKKADGVSELETELGANKEIEGGYRARHQRRRGGAGQRFNEIR